MPHAASKRRSTLRSAGICLASAFVLTVLSVLLSAAACEMEVVDRPRAKWNEPWRLGPVTRSMRDVAADYELRQDYGFPFTCIGYQRHYGWRAMNLREAQIIDRSMKPVEYVRARYFHSAARARLGDSAEDQAFIAIVNAVAKDERALMRWRCSWLGLVMNVAVYLVMLSGAVGAVRFARARLTRKDACRRCRYPYEGLPTPVCPECGEPR